MSNLKEHAFHTSVADRSSIKGHPPLLVWFTGLSGSGKSTLADALEKYLVANGIHAYHLDGDAIRSGINADLGFLPADRDENLRRVGELAALMLDAGLVVIAAFVSPLRKHRDAIRQRVGSQRMVEVYVNTPLEVCETRDIKGFYKKARNGEIKDFTGVSAPYEEPLNAELTLDTAQLSVEKAIELLIFELCKKGLSINEKNNESFG
jgi:adenylyl-sulfate kinase